MKVASLIQVSTNLGKKKIRIFILLERPRLMLSVIFKGKGHISVFRAFSKIQPDSPFFGNKISIVHRSGDYYMKVKEGVIRCICVHVYAYHNLFLHYHVYTLMILKYGVRVQLYIAMHQNRLYTF